MTNTHINVNFAIRSYFELDYFLKNYVYIQARIGGGGGSPDPKFCALNFPCRRDSECAMLTKSRLPLSPSYKNHRSVPDIWEI